MADIKSGREAATADLSASLQQFTKLFVGNPATLDQLPELSGELAQFMTGRLIRNLDMMREISQCRGPADMAAAQLRWVQSMVDDYVAEANRLIELNGGIIGRFGVRSDKSSPPPVTGRTGIRLGT